MPRSSCEELSLANLSQSGATNVTTITKARRRRETSQLIPLHEPAARDPRVVRGSVIIRPDRLCSANFPVLTCGRGFRKSREPLQLGETYSNQ
jgi:hypothetical protein